MKKYLLKILLFFTIVLVIDLAFGAFGDYLQAHAKSGVTRRTQALTMDDSHDVLILGSSRAHHHYDTPFLSDTLGLDVYNAGYDGNGVVLAYGLLGLVLERYKPQLIIYDVTPAFDIEVYDGDNKHTRYISGLKPYYRNDAVKDIIRDVSKEEWYKAHSGMIRYNTKILTMLQDMRGSDNRTLRGFSPTKGVYTKEPKVETGLEEVDEFKLNYIEKLIYLAQSNNIPVLFVASPKYGQTSSEVMQPVKDICEKHKVAFYDYYASPLFIWHKEWFKEPMHLNAEGARAFSRIMAELIGQILPNLI